MSGVLRYRASLAVLIFGLALHCSFPIWMPMLAAHFGISDNAVGMIGAVHESLSSLLSFFVIWEACKYEQTHGIGIKNSWIPWLKALGIASLLVAIGDLNYGFTTNILRIPPPRGLIPLVHELPYAFFSVYLAYAVTLRALQGLRSSEKIWVWVLIVGLASLYGVASYHLILSPFFHAKPVRPLALYETATIYAAAQSVFLGSLIVASFRTIGFAEFGLWALFLTLTGSDFALRYQDMGGVIPAVSTFEYGWEFALAGISSVLLFARMQSRYGVRPFWEKNPAPILSFRVLTAVITLAALVAFFVGTWKISAILGMAAAGALGSAIVYFVFVWAVSNGMSILLSQGFREVYAKLKTSSAESLECGSQQGLLWEVKDLFQFLALRNAALDAEKKHVVRITASVAHNVKPPLASIKTATLVLERYAPKTSDVEVMEEWNDTMELLREAYRSMKATADLMLSERKRIRQEEEIEDAAKSAVHVAQSNYPSKKFKLSFADEAKGRVSLGLSPHLVSLLSNAADATKEDSSPIELNVEQDGNSVKIEVLDQGAGIAPGLLTALRRGEERTTKRHGNGVGVSSLVRWVRENRYEFQLESRLGKGTKAILKIPTELGGVS
jgi:two-component system sensor histidine kinase FlrB